MPSTVSIIPAMNSAACVVKPACTSMAIAAKPIINNARPSQFMDNPVSMGIIISIMPTPAR